MLWTQYGLGVVPAVGSSPSEADRDRADRETAKATVILEKTSPAQVALFRHLAESAPNGRYVVPRAQWIATVLKATTGVEEPDVAALFALDWTPESMTLEELRKKVLKALSTIR